jgi:hypothetical protein
MIDPSRVVLSVLSPYPELRLDPGQVLRALRYGDHLERTLRERRAGSTQGDRDSPPPLRGYPGQHRRTLS